jgi:hypothetical protein
MTTMHASAEITEKDGVLVGPLREPRNLAANEAGSIHDDAQAQRLGFRGGTVAGSIHMEQFPPLLVAAFGNRWFETGGLSCYFRNATIDREPVRAFVELPFDVNLESPAINLPGGIGGMSFDPPPSADAQVNVWMERDDGTLVLEGTASVGSPSEASLLRSKLSEEREAGEQRILGHLAVGEMGEPVKVRLATADATKRLDAITEPMDWYTGKSPWAGAIVEPGLLVHMMVQVQRRIALPTDAVGLYGAIEVQHLAGPVLMERDYTVSGQVLAVGQTPKTEYLWYETVMRDGSTDIASMLMMLRFMKASSPLWADG